MKHQIYVVGHKDFELPTNDSLYIPLMVGHSKSIINDRYVTDDVGDNISDKNPWYNELTGLYWIWKNSDADVVGICHYRRYFVNPLGKIENIVFKKDIQPNWLLNKNNIDYILSRSDVIVHNKTFFKESNMKQLCIKEDDSEKERGSKVSREMLDLAGEVFENLYPSEKATYDKVMFGHSAHLLNLMICKRELFDKYCEWLFPLLENVEEKAKDKCNNTLPKRYIGLLAERFLDVWIMSNKLKIKENYSVNTERIDWKMW